MQSVQVSSATVAHVIHPSPYRVAVLGRRIRASASVSALLSELAYGVVHREHDGSLPIAFAKSECR